MKKVVRGELTAFLALIFGLLLSLIGSLVFSVSIQISKNEKRADAGRAAESVFAEYQRDLLEEFMVFALDGSYETGNFDESSILNRLSFYGAENMETEIEAIRYLTDGDGERFYRQAVEYAKEEVGLGLLEDLSQEYLGFQETERVIEEYEEKAEQAEIELNGTLNETQLPTKDNPLETVKQMKSGLMDMVLPADFEVSQGRIDPDLQPSKRQLRQGYGNFEVEPLQKTDRLFFDLYLAEMFGNGLEPAQAPLQYQQEYLIAGEASDFENLKSVINRLCIIRYAMDYAYILQDEELKAEAKIIAGVLCLLAMAPTMTDAVTQIVLLAWAYGEAVMDVRCLMAGGKVPLIKTKELWKTSLENLMSAENFYAESPGDGKEQGMGYDEYLDLQMCLVGRKKVTMRALDLVEQKITSVPGQEGFRVDGCVSAAKFHVVAPLTGGFTYEFTTQYQYH